MTTKNIYDTVVVGGGAAGICAAISAAKRGRSVLICEKTARTGKKILASGDGRCNLLNDNMDAGFFNINARNLVSTVFSKFGKKEILAFFRELGLETCSREGRIFPVTNQAATVMKLLEMELARLSIPTELNFNCTEISFAEGFIYVTSSENKTVKCERAIITGGGKTYPAFGSDGSTFELAKRLGHSIIQPVPSAVPLVVKDKLCSTLQGQKITATARSVINGKPGPVTGGELLFTRYGLSGTCILDVSEPISIAIHRQNKTNVSVMVDMIPFMEREQLKKELTLRIKKKLPEDEILAGLLPNKMSHALKNIFDNENINTAVTGLKERHFKIESTRGWNEAEFTAGGINVKEINHATLESRIHKGIYFAGEVLDVTGRRGGYNLGWAWASGIIAGMA